MGKPFKNLIKKTKLRLDPSIPPHMKSILSVEGQISAREAGLLYRLASEVEAGPIVEVGSFRGRSTVALALGSKAGSKVPVYAVDPHEEFTGALGAHFGPQDRIAFFQNILKTGTGDVVRLINLPSLDAARGWTRGIAFLWLDGDHTYEAVKQDFDAWSPHVRNNGNVAFHDVVEPHDGPSRIIKEAVDSGHYLEIERVDKMVVLKKSRKDP